MVIYFVIEKIENSYLPYWLVDLQHELLFLSVLIHIDLRHKNFI